MIIIINTNSIFLLAYKNRLVLTSATTKIFSLLTKAYIRIIAMSSLRIYTYMYTLPHVSPCNAYIILKGIIIFFSLECCISRALEKIIPFSVCKWQSVLLNYISFGKQIIENCIPFIIIRILWIIFKITLIKDAANIDAIMHLKLL